MAIEALEPIVGPLASIWDGVQQAVPGILGAIVVLVVGYMVAWLVAWLVRNFFERTGLDQWIVKKTNLDILFGQLHLSGFLAALAKWFTFVAFVPSAAGLLTGMDMLADFLREAALWIPNVIAAVLLGLVGYAVANYVAAAIVKTKAKGASVIGDGARMVIYVFTVLSALRQVGVNVQIAESAILLVLGGVMLAIAIGFGLALKDFARKWVADWSRRL